MTKFEYILKMTLKLPDGIRFIPAGMVEGSIVHRDPLQEPCIYLFKQRGESDNFDYHSINIPRHLEHSKDPKDFVKFSEYVMVQALEFQKRVANVD